MIVELDASITRDDLILRPGVGTASDTRELIAELEWDAHGNRYIVRAQVAGKLPYGYVTRIGVQADGSPVLPRNWEAPGEPIDPRTRAARDVFQPWNRHGGKLGEPVATLPRAVANVASAWRAEVRADRPNG